MPILEMPRTQRWCVNITKKERILQNAINNMRWSEVPVNRLQDIINHLKEVKNTKRRNQLRAGIIERGVRPQFARKKYPKLNFSSSEYEEESSDQDLENLSSADAQNDSWNSVPSADILADSNPPSVGVSPPRNDGKKPRLETIINFDYTTSEESTYSVYVGSPTQRELPPPHKRTRSSTPEAAAMDFDPACSQCRDAPVRPWVESARPREESPRPTTSGLSDAIPVDQFEADVSDEYHGEHDSTNFNYQED